jgi:hypothetical protein
MVNVSNTTAAARQAVPNPEPTEEWSGMEEAIRASLETVTVESEPEDFDAPTSSTRITSKHPQMSNGKKASHRRRRPSTSPAMS